MSNEQNESMSLEDAFVENMNEMRKKEELEEEKEKEKQEKNSQDDSSLMESDEKPKIKGEISTQKLYENYKRDIGLSEFNMHKAIKSVEEWVKNVKTERAYKMRNDFDEEKEKKLEKQFAIKNQIEELSNDNENQKLIAFFNDKIKQQEDLFNKFYDMKKIITEKNKMLKDNIIDLEKKANEQKDILRQLNRDNLILMEQINKFEKELPMQINQQTNRSNLINNNNSNLISSNSFNTSKNNLYTMSTNMGGLSTTMNKSNLFKSSTLNDTKNNSLNNTTTYTSNYNEINIKEILEKNDKLKKKYERNKMLKKNLNNKKKENDYLIKNINEMNNSYYNCRKVFSEGMHEIAKELLKINEIELEKVVNNTNNNSNSLYFDIFKTNYNSGQLKNDFLRLPLINNNKNVKYKYPPSEMAEPSGLLYKVIKNIIEENNLNAKINNMKENKFSWDEFKEFSGYQVYTLLNLNKDNLKKLEQCVFPFIPLKKLKELEN